MKYFYRGKFDPRKLPSLNIDREVVSFVPENSRVLEIGCADGFMGEYLIREKNCTVVGVEIDRQSSKVAESKGLKVFCGDIEQDRVLNQLKKEKKFQVILCSSVIEHLVNPFKALKNWHRFLDTNGSLIVSTPNIAHWSARLKIMSGKFPREEFGIFDKNHLHFFTLDSFESLIEGCGYIIEELGIDPVGGGFPKISKFFSVFLPRLFAYQVVIKAKIV